MRRDLDSKQQVVTLTEFKKDLSRYLRLVRSGEGLLVRNRGACVARVVPVDPEYVSDHEARLVAEGKLKLPEREMDWDEFFTLPKAGNVSRKKVLEAVRWAKGNR
jgi:prevent-host-death family protein